MAEIRSGGYVLHVGIGKRLLLSLLVSEGAQCVLKGWSGTDEEARVAIESDPREFFVLDPACDNQGPDGACQGHGEADPLHERVARSIESQISRASRESER